jgi:hypothetical protein
MIIVKVELHSAVTGEVSILEQIAIGNDLTGDDELGNYDVAQMNYPESCGYAEWGNALILKDSAHSSKIRKVKRHVRKSSVLHLVSNALKALGYGDDT